MSARVIGRPTRRPQAEGEIVDLIEFGETAARRSFFSLGQYFEYIHSCNAHVCF
jgi:hypothetical protein